MALRLLIVIAYTKYMYLLLARLANLQRAWRFGQSRPCMRPSLSFIWPSVHHVAPMFLAIKGFAIWCCFWLVLSALQALGISSTNFTGLSALTVICALSNLLPLCLIWMIPARIEEPGLSASTKGPRRLPQKAEDSASTAADSDVGASATSASSSDVEAGSQWRRRSNSSLTRRGTVQVVGGGPEDCLSALDSQDSFSALGAVAGHNFDAMAPGHIFDCGGSGECAVTPQRRW